MNSFKFLPVIPNWWVKRKHNTTVNTLLYYNKFKSISLFIYFDILEINAFLIQKGKHIVQKR